MGTTLFLIEGKFESSPLNTIILILIGMAIYFIVALILKDEMIFIGIKLIKSKLHKKGDNKIE